MRFTKLARSAGIQRRPAAGMTSKPDAIRELLRKLREQRTAYEVAGAMVNGARLLDSFIDSLAPLAALPEPTHNLVDASKLCGYSADYLGRLVREGKISNHGRPNAPRVRLSECPQKAIDSTLPVRLASSKVED